MKVEIEFMDGAETTIHDVNSIMVEDKTLHLSHVTRDRGVLPASEHHFGSFPLMHIRRWRKVAE